jgi:hypothetical protein
LSLAVSRLGREVEINQGVTFVIFNETFQ